MFNNTVFRKLAADLENLLASCAAIRGYIFCMVVHIIFVVMSRVLSWRCDCGVRKLPWQTKYYLAYTKIGGHKMSSCLKKIGNIEKKIYYAKNLSELFTML